MNTRLFYQVILFFFAFALWGASCDEQKKKQEETPKESTISLNAEHLEEIRIEDKIICDTPCYRISDFIVDDILDTAYAEPTSYFIGPNGVALAAPSAVARINNVKHGNNQWYLPNQKNSITTGAKGDYLEVPVSINGETFHLLLRKDYIRQAVHLTSK